jgi:hypothetical protein
LGDGVEPMIELPDGTAVVGAQTASHEERTPNEPALDGAVVVAIGRWLGRRKLDGPRERHSVGEGL